MFKKKKLISALLGAITVLACVGATDAVIRPEARITFVVKDDFGKPIPNMVVGMSTVIPQNHDSATAARLLYAVVDLGEDEARWSTISSKNGYVLVCNPRTHKI